MPSRPIRSRRDLFSLTPAPAEPDDPFVHIASLLVQIAPERVDALRERVAAIAGAELHVSDHPGRVVVVLETANERSLADATQQLHDVPGVLTVSIVAHLMERASALAEEVDDEPSAVSQA